MTTDAVVVGGGFYGCALALHLRRRTAGRVVLMEAAPSLLQRATLANQARVHNGYHYPRSILTGLRSRVNYPRFLDEYSDCIDHRFDWYYAIARVGSNVNAAQFIRFCERIEAPLRTPPAHIQRLFSPAFIEAVFAVREATYDAAALGERMSASLDRDGVEVWLETEATRVERAERDAIMVWYRARGSTASVTSGAVYTCTYSRTNHLLSSSGLPSIPLKHEITESAMVEVPEELERLALTVMCGPFFSLVPYPARRLHTLSHVRYTPHGAWVDDGVSPCRDPDAVLAARPSRSNYPHMVRDAERYLPLARRCHYRGSFWEVKTVLPRSEIDDSRPILLRRHHGLRNLTCILGSKIDNVYDVLESVSPDPG